MLHYFCCLDWGCMKNTRLARYIGAGSACGLVLLGIAAGPVVAAPVDDGLGPISEETASVLDSVSQDDVINSMLALEKVGAIGAEGVYDGLYLGSELVDGDTIVVRYNNTAEAARKFESLVRAAAEEAPLKIELRGVAVDPGALNRLAAEVSAGDSTKLRALGVTGVSAVGIDDTTGELTVQVSGKTPRSAAVIDGVKVNFAPSATVDFQSRQLDSNPWSGGALLNGGRCTAGFNWKKWSSGEVMGSSAEHCFEATNISTWKNGAANWGTRYYYSKPVDAFLSRSNPQGQYSATAFLGGPSSNDFRKVTTASADVSGGVVAFGGGVSGLSAGKNTSFTFYASGKGPFRLTTVTSCVGGDSGGPWLTTHSNRTINAIGQHGGYYDDGSRRGCFYMPVTKISGALSASIYTG